MNVNSWMLLKYNRCYQRIMSNERLGVPTKPSPESLL